MNMENFITGYPANEEAMREALYSVLGPERYERFFDRFLEGFFGAGDAARPVGVAGGNTISGVMPASRERSLTASFPSPSLTTVSTR